MEQNRSKKKKEKKEKIKYIDDGSSLSDMSGLTRDTGFGTFSGKKKSAKSPHVRSPFRSQWETYIQSVRMMFVPMLVVIGILCIAFLLLYLFMK